jgi:hypothetical protein
LQLGQPEVEDLDLPVGRQEQVLRLQVPMDDPSRVGRRQAPADLHPVLGCLSHGDRPALQPLLQRLPVEQLEHDVRRPVLRAHVMDGQDVGVAQRGDGPGLLLETALTVGLPGLVG